MEVVRVSDSRVQFELSLNHRVSFIRGDSGTGKTYLFNTLANILDNALVNSNIVKSVNIGEYKVESTLPIVSVNSFNSLKGIYEANRGGSILFILDEDFSGLNSSKFANYVNIVTDAYFLIISREINNANLIYSANAIYELNSIVKDGITYSFNVEYIKTTKLIKTADVNYSKTIYVEDNAEGKLLLDLFTIPEVRVISTKGKDNVLNEIRATGSKKDIDILVVDMCAYGSNYLRFKRELEKSGYKVAYCVDYTSFEYLLLSILKVEVKDYLNEAKLKEYGVSEEKYYENYLNSVCTEYLGYSYVKGATPSIVVSNTSVNAIREFCKEIPLKWLVSTKSLIHDMFLALSTNDKGKIVLNSIVEDKVLGKPLDSISKLILFELAIGLYIQDVTRFKSRKLVEILYTNRGLHDTLIVFYNTLGLNPELTRNKDNIDIYLFKEV